MADDVAALAAEVPHHDVAERFAKVRDLAQRAL
jgi:hypothetical protein